MKDISFRSSVVTTIVFFVIMFTSLSSWSQRALSIKLKWKLDQPHLIIKYKGEIGDYFSPFTTDYYQQLFPGDSVRLMNDFDESISGVLFFVTVGGDSILYEVWDLSKIDNNEFDKFDYSFYEFCECPSFKRRRVKYSFPLSFHPSLINSNLSMVYRIMVQKSVCGEPIEVLEARLKLGYSQ